LIGPQGLLLLGAQVLATLAAAVAQKWGLFAGRPSKMPTINQGDAWATGTWDPKGSNTFTFTFTGPAYIDTGGGVCHLESRTLTFTHTVSGGEQLFALDRGYGSYGGCSNLEASPGSGVPNKEPIQIWGLDRSQGLYGTRPTGVWFKDFHTLITVKSNTATSVPYPDRPTAWPGGYAPSPVPAPETLPPTPRPSIPGTTPLPSPVPAEPTAEPAPNPLPVPTPIQRPTLAPPLALPGQGTENGKLLPPARLPVPVTPGDAVYPIPGGKPILGNGPQANLTEIAKELGRIEQKQHLLLNPLGMDGEDWLEIAGRLLGWLNGRSPAALYRLTSCCEIDDQGDPIDKAVEVDIPAQGDTDAILARLDALAVLMQGLKDFRQPVCKKVHRLQGRDITLNFRELSAFKRAGEAPIRKIFNYRSLNPFTLADLEAHWIGFEFDTGPVQVTFEHKTMGRFIVWAISEEEGRRVISHAQQQAGWDFTEGLWHACETRHTRYGVATRVQVVKISAREGPSG
jgi:hypothetical protein